MSLRLIMGPMFAGKTTKIIELLSNPFYKNMKSLNINYSKNNRYGTDENITHDGNKINTTYKGPQWRSYNTNRNYNYANLHGALIWYCQNKNINYMLIETCKKDSYIRRQKITHTILEYIYYKYLT